ncbi:MAG: hypothetical protein NVS2B7_21430 [Herpetosiphon sp.]
MAQLEVFVAGPSWSALSPSDASTISPTPSGDAASSEDTIPQSSAIDPPQPPFSSLAALKPQQLPPLVNPSVTMPAASSADVHPASTPAQGPAIPADVQRRAAPGARIWTLSSFEQLLSGRGLAWTGGLALLLGVVFFLGLSFTRGWIGPTARVSSGLGVGMLITLGGSWFFERSEKLFGHVLVAVGIGMVSLSILAATRLYALISPSVGLFSMVLVAIIASAIALHVNAQVIAGYGLVAALAAPPVLGASADNLTLAFLAATLIGTTGIALYRSWAWLPPAAFVVVAPQVWLWLTGDAALATGLLVLLGFWLINTISAGGEEFRGAHQTLRPTSATLVVVNALFIVAGGLMFLAHHQAEPYQGLFVCLVAVAHAGIATYFLDEAGLNHPFGLLVAGTGLAALTLAIPLQVGASLVPLGWAAETVVLVWVAERLKHAYADRASRVLVGLTTLHLLFVEYPLWKLKLGDPGHQLFINKQGLALIFVVLAWGLAATLVTSQLKRTLFATTAMLLLIYALPFETTGLPLYFGWCLLMVAGVGLNRLAGQPIFYTRSDRATAAVPIPSWIAAGLVTFNLVGYELIIDKLGRPLPSTPFRDTASGAVACLVVAALMAALWVQRRGDRQMLVVGALGFLAYLMPFEVPTLMVAVTWSSLAFILVILARLDLPSTQVYLSAGAALGTLSGLQTILVIAPPSHLFVTGYAVTNHPPLLSSATVALAWSAILLTLTARLFRSRPAAQWLAVGAGALVVYLISIGVVDEFQRWVVQGSSVIEIHRQSQVALSIVWAMIGGGVFIAGVIRHRGAYRGFGLALLALATAKVFIYDMAALDATYKVLSFIGLGILLLASSYVYQRLNPTSKPQKV